MYRTFIAIVLPFATLALPSPSRALGSPPGGTSGRMVFQRDDVADGLRKYRRAKDGDKRSLLLSNLARTQDPRVAVELGVRAGGRGAEARLAVYLLNRHFAQRRACGAPNDDEYTIESIRMILVLPDDNEYARDWWKDHEADLRRRASQLPQ